MDPDKDLETFLNEHKGEMVIVRPINQSLSYLLEPISCQTTNNGTNIIYRNGIVLSRTDTSIAGLACIGENAKRQIDMKSYSPEGKIRIECWCTYTSLPKERSDAIKTMFP